MAERRGETTLTVIRPGALGDTLLALPALAWLRAHAQPPPRVTLIARADVLPLALASGLAETVWPWDLPDWSALYDPAANPARLTTRARAALAEANAIAAWLPDGDGALATTLRRLGQLSAGRVVVAPPRPDETPGAPGESAAHVALWLARSLAPLGLTPATDTLTRATLWRALGSLRWPEEDERAAGAIWRALGLDAEGVVALHPGAGGGAKRWPAERFAALARLARAAGYTPLLLAGPADAGVAEAVQAAVRDIGAAPLRETHDLGLGTLAASLARCAAYAGNDSGVSHLAGLLGVPTLAIFGPTDPARWSPLGPRVAPVRAPAGDLTRLAPEAVWAALRGVMG